MTDAPRRAGSIDVEHPGGVEGAKGEGEAHVVDDVLEAAVGAPPGDDVANVAAERDHPGVVDRVLARLPRDDQVALADAPLPTQQVQAPTLSPWPSTARFASYRP